MCFPWLTLVNRMPVRSCWLGSHGGLYCTLIGLICLCFVLLPFFYKIASVPPGTQAASLDIERAYHNSPIAPIHKPYLAVSWQDKVFIGHVAVDGLATAGGIQGTPADALLDILRFHNIEHVFKWVDDVVIFRIPTPLYDPYAGSVPLFNFDLDSIFSITAPLGIPWHPMASHRKKGPRFCFLGQICWFPLGS